MYEFEFINQNLIKQYAEAMNGMIKQENRECSEICVSTE